MTVLFLLLVVPVLILTVLALLVGNRHPKAAVVLSNIAVAVATFNLIVLGGALK